jgi:hypothetical protein
MIIAVDGCVGHWHLPFLLHKRRCDLRNAYGNVFSLRRSIGQCLSLTQFKNFPRIRGILFIKGGDFRPNPEHLRQFRAL